MACVKIIRPSLHLVWHSFTFTGGRVLHVHLTSPYSYDGINDAYSKLEVRGKLADIGLVSVARGNVRWEGDHIRVVLKPKDSRGITKEVVTRISACLRKIGCRCVLDQVSIAQQQQVQLDVQCVNRFEPLSSDDECVDVIAVEEKVKAVTGNKCERKLRIGTWNFAGLSVSRRR